MELDTNTLRSLATVVSFVTFMGIVAWAWSRRNARDFEEAANHFQAITIINPDTDRIISLVEPNLRDSVQLIYHLKFTIIVPIKGIG